MAGASRIGVVGVPFSRGFSEKEKPSPRAVLESRPQCLLPCRGERRCRCSSSFSSRHPRRWRLSEMRSEVVRRAVITSRNSSTRIRAGSQGIDTEDIEVDLNVQPKRPLRPVVERFNIYHEKSVGEERLKELGVSRWSKWDCGPGVTTFWQWKVDELVYVSKGSVEVVPDGCNDAAFFYAGDLVLFPKWFEASLTFVEDYEQYYKFSAYGD